LQLQAIREPDTMDGDTPFTRRVGLGTISHLGESSVNFVIDAIERQIATNKRNSQAVTSPVEVQMNLSRHGSCGIDCDAA
jgi:hypothetical protein